MKNTIKTTKTAIACSLLLLAVLLSSCQKEVNPKIGDVWRWHTRESKNPFVKGTLAPYYDYKVLDIKGEYIQYLDLSDSTIESSSIRMFKVSAERLNSQ